MADTGKIAKNLERFAIAIAAHDRENPTHTAFGIGLSHFDMERLGFDEGEEVLPGITIQCDSGVSGQLPRALRRRARRGADGGRGGGRRGRRHPGGAQHRSARRPDARTVAEAPPRRPAGSIPARAAMIVTSRSIVGQASPWRAAARSTEPGIASSSGARPAAMSRCIELPSVACARSSSSIAVSPRRHRRPPRGPPPPPPRSRRRDRRAARASSGSRRAACRRRWSCRRARSAARASTTSRRLRSRAPSTGTPASLERVRERARSAPPSRGARSPC